MSQNNSAHGCVDFSLSSKFISNEFLTIIMDNEKSGYANQQSLFDKILLESESNIFQRQEKLLERLITIKGSLLDDDDLIPFVTDQNIKLNSYQEALSEAVHIE